MPKRKVLHVQRRRAVAALTEPGPRAGGAVFLSFVQPALDRAFDGAAAILTPAAAAAEFRRLGRLATDADAASALRLGYLYDEGLGAPQDRALARIWYERAAARGSARAALCLGRMDYFGLGVEPDYTAAAMWYEQAARGDEPAAFANLGYMYAHGLGVPRDYGQAFRWLRQGAERGDSKAQSNLALIHYHRHEHAEAVRWHLAAAERGNGPSMCNLGEIYASGTGVPRDLSQAAKWFALGALYRKEQANDRLAELTPGLCASQWSSVVRESRQGAAAGRPRAQLLLGALHSEGLGVAKDAKAAVRWLRAAARQGNTKAQWRLGYIYYNGLGVRRDDRSAFKMFWKAAWKNDTHSQIMLGECYRRGRGTAKNLDEAEKWYRRVAERGSPPAQAALAEMIARRRGAGRDPAQAALWALLAVAQGAAGADARWDVLRRALTAERENEVRWRALRRWPSLSWKNPLASLGRLLSAVNESLPPGRAPVTESALIGIWTPPRAIEAEKKADR